MSNHTLVLIKPDAVRRKLIGQILSFFENKQIKILRLEMFQPDEKRLRLLYQEHKDKDFFLELITFMMSGPIVAAVLEHPNVVPITRSIIGATNPENALPGTIRFCFGTVVEENLVHASASEADAIRELRLFFPELG